MSDCIFCKLANGEIPTRTVYEDEKFRVILDAAPATFGHSLIIPKEHFANVFEIPESLLADAAALGKKMAGRMKEKLGADGVNLVQNNGEAAGQTVFHYHMHVIPRFSDPKKDNPGNVMWKHLELSDAEFDKALEELKQ